MVSTSREWLHGVDSGPPDLAACDVHMAQNRLFITLGSLPSDRSGMAR